MSQSLMESRIRVLSTCECAYLLPLSILDTAPLMTVVLVSLHFPFDRPMGDSLLFRTFTESSHGTF